MNNHSSNSTKRIIKTQKGYRGDSVNKHQAIEHANLDLSKKELQQQNENL